MKKKLLTILTCLTLSACSVSSTVEERTITQDYPSLPEDTTLYYGDEERVIAMLENGIGVIFFGDVTDESSQSVVTALDEVGRETDLSILCYDLAEDKEKNSDFYTQLLETMNKLTETKDSSDLEAIYTPSTYFVSKGNILSVSIGADTKENYSEFADQIVKLQEAANADGCDTGCKVEAPSD